MFTGCIELAVCLATMAMGLKLLFHIFNTNKAKTGSISGCRARTLKDVFKDSGGWVRNLEMCQDSGAQALGLWGGVRI